MQSSIAQLTAIFPGDYVHAHGSAEACRHYVTKPNDGCVCEHCSKERAHPTYREGPWELGTPTRQGTRTDCIEFNSAVTTGATRRKMHAEFPTLMLRYPRHFAAVAALKEQPPPKNDKHIIVFWGDTGLRKSDCAYYHFPDLYGVPAIVNRVWFQHYDQQQTVLFDEFSGQCTLDFFLMLTHTHASKQEMKGDSVWFNPDRIVFTSNEDPYRWYDATRHRHSVTKMKAYERRFTHIFHWCKLTGISQTKGAPLDVEVYSDALLYMERQNERILESMVSQLHFATTLDVEETSTLGVDASASLELDSPSLVGANAFIRPPRRFILPSINYSAIEMAQHV